MLERNGDLTDRKERVGSGFGRHRMESATHKEKLPSTHVECLVPSILTHELSCATPACVGLSILTFNNVTLHSVVPLHAGQTQDTKLVLERCSLCAYQSGQDDVDAPDRSESRPHHLAAGGCCISDRMSVVTEQNLCLRSCPTCSMELQRLLQCTDHLLRMPPDASM